MSPPAKPEKDAGHSDSHGKKKSVWSAVGVVISVGIGVIVLFTLGGALFGMGIDSFSNAIQIVSNSIANVGVSIGKNATNGVRVFSHGVSVFLISLFSALIVPVILFLIGRMVVNEMKKGKGDGH